VPMCSSSHSTTCMLPSERTIHYECKIEEKKINVDIDIYSYNMPLLPCCKNKPVFVAQLGYSTAHTA
jgi:hypothetical protein